MKIYAAHTIGHSVYFICSVVTRQAVVLHACNLLPTFKLVVHEFYRFVITTTRCPHREDGFQLDGGKKSKQRYVNSFPSRLQDVNMELFNPAELHALFAAFGFYC